MPAKLLAALVICLSLFMLVTPVCTAESMQEAPASESTIESGSQPISDQNPASTTEVEPSETPIEQSTPSSVAPEPAAGSTTDQISPEEGANKSIEEQAAENDVAHLSEPSAVAPEPADSGKTPEKKEGKTVEEQTDVNTPMEPTIESEQEKPVTKEKDIITDVSDLPQNVKPNIPRSSVSINSPRLKSMTVQGLMSTNGLLGSGIIQHTLSPGQSASDSISIKIPMAVQKTDVLFVFDTTASTWYTNKTAAQDCTNVMNQLNQMGDVDYGVATFMDYTNTYTSYGYSAKYGGVSEGDYPYRLDQPITSNDSLVISAFNNLPCGSGWDPPEAYTRALYESYADTAVSWRPEARRIVVLIGDSNPHDNNLYEGFNSTLFSLGGDPGRDGVMFTADDLDWQTVLQEMAANNTVLIHCRTANNYLSLWNFWTAMTGGETIDASGGSVESALASAITSRIAQNQVTNLHLVPSDNGSWVTFDPVSYPVAALGTTKLFTATFSIPPGTMPGTYNFNLSAVDDTGTSFGDTPVEITVPLAVLPTAEISYSPEVLTNGSVTASLVNANKAITVTNNGGSTVYTFTENGSFTFEFVDELGYTGTATATVNWIDKSMPTASISYSPNSLTNTTVTASLVDPSEPITITNNGGSDTYSFANNGSFTFEFKDAAGNAGTATATVTWIDKVKPTAEISYDSTAPTNGDVIVTLVNPSEPITIIGNGGSNVHTFTENGLFTFTFKDMAGNTGDATAYVNWIDKSVPAATISYTPATATNGSVVAKMTPSEPVTITNNSGSDLYTFSDNGSFTFEFKDMVGNSGTAKATVFWIDKTAPVAEVSFDITNPTNGSVTATLVNPSKPITVTNNGGSLNHTFADNGSFAFEFVDQLGNTGSATAVVSWIDLIAPTVQINYYPATVTSGPVMASIETSSEPIIITNNGGISSYVFNNNGSFTFEFKDAAGNTSKAAATVTWIDKTKPTAEVNYSVTKPINGDVTATLVNPSEPITITNNGGSDRYIFSENGSFTFEFKDAAGNTGMAIATVAWIDKTVPTAGVSYYPIDPTNGNVTASLVDPSEPITITNNGGSDQYTFTENGSFTFEFKDAAGNTGTVTATVTWIDKEIPTAQVSYSPSTATNGSVVAVLANPSEPITITNNGGSSSYTFNNNGTFTFNFKDAAGNVGTAVANVFWIDKIAPTATISYSVYSATNGSVVASLINPSESITITNNGGSNQYAFNANGSFTFAFKDAVGNTSSATATVTWIDKEMPTAQVSYNPSTSTTGPVTATLVNPSEPITITNNGGSDKYVFTQNGSFTFQFKDAAGNQGTATATVTWINTESRNGKLYIACPLYVGCNRIGYVNLSAVKTSSSPTATGYFKFQNSSCPGFSIWGPKSWPCSTGSLISFFMSDLNTSDKRVILEYAVGGVCDAKHINDPARRVKITINGVNKPVSFEMVVYDANGTVLSKQTGVLAQGTVLLWQ